MNTKPKLFQHHEGSPFHISVGAVLVNAEGKICVHTFSKDGLNPKMRASLKNLVGLSILMRESLEEGETLEQAVLRGIREEFGAEGEIQRYLGSIQGVAFDPAGNTSFEKTTLYFEVKLTRLGERPKDDAEAGSTLEWLAPSVLIERMKQQASTERDDVDESKIIEAYLKYK